MIAPNLVAQWSACAPRLLSLLRIATAFIFITAGTTILFAFPSGMPPDGGTAPPLSQLWVGGILEMVGGALLLLGLFTRPVAFVLSGMMAVAYFQFHFPPPSTAFSGSTSPPPARAPGAWTPGGGTDLTFLASF